MRLKKYVAMFLFSIAMASNSGVCVHASEYTISAEATAQVSDSTQVSISSEQLEAQVKAINKNTEAITNRVNEIVSGTEDSGDVADAAGKASGKVKKGSAVSYSKKELRYMASIIYCEAGNQSYAGKLAVGIVVKNRMESKQFPNTIKKVLYQRNQFTPTRNGSLNRALKVYDKNGFKKGSYTSCLKAAKEALSGQKTVTVKGKKKNMEGYYFFSRYVSGCRIKIGAHMFK